MTNDDLTREQLNDLIDQHAAQLGEHFDSVRIFCTKHNTELDGESTTQGYTKGRGNWFAQAGQIDEWMEQQKEDARVVQRINSCGGGEE